jgi:hypothetical protein
MVETTRAAADFVTAIPSLWEAIKIPGAITLIIVGLGGAIISLHKGVGAAAGKLLGGIMLGVVVLGAVGLMVSVKTTIDRHSGGVMIGQYGQ